MQHHLRDAVEQVFPEATVAHRGVEITVRRRDQPEVRLLGLGALVAERAIVAELREVEEQLLRVHREVEQLVEHQRAAVGELHEADALVGGAGEAAPLVPEELRGDGVEVVARAQHGPHHRPAPAGLGDGGGEERLARPGLADDEDRCVRVERGADLLGDGLHRRRADEVGEAWRAPGIGGVALGLTQVRAIVLAAVMLLEHGADEQRSRREELDV